MILTTHAIVGAALASFLSSHPAAAFVAGFASHFVLDAIPHVDYPIKSQSVNPRIGAPMAFDRALLEDALTIGTDGLFGIIAALFLFSTTASLSAILMGAIGAMLPDPLQFVHSRGGHDPDPHRLQIVDDGLGAARLGAVVVRVRLVDNRTFHVGVSRVRGAHHFGQSLEARIARLTHRVTDDDVPDRS